MVLRLHALASFGCALLVTACGGAADDAAADGSGALDRGRASGLDAVGGSIALETGGLTLTASTAPAYRTESTPWAPAKGATEQPVARDVDDEDAEGGDSEEISLIKPTAAPPADASPSLATTDATPSERAGAGTSNEDSSAPDGTSRTDPPPRENPVSGRSLSHLFPRQIGLADVHASIEVLSPSRLTDRRTPSTPGFSDPSAAREEIDALFEKLRESVRPTTGGSGARKDEPQVPEERRSSAPPEASEPAPDKPAEPAPSTPPPPRDPSPRPPDSSPSEIELADNGGTVGAAPTESDDLKVPDLSPMIDTPPGLSFGINLGPAPQPYDFGGQGE